MVRESEGGFAGQGVHLPPSTHPCQPSQHFAGYNNNNCSVEDGGLLRGSTLHRLTGRVQCALLQPTQLMLHN